MLPEVERLLLRLVQLREEAVRANARLDQAGSADELLAAQLDLDEHVREARAATERLAGIGCVLRDLDLGLVDFPARAGDLDVFLCWRLGEDAIRYWHGTDEGFAGRKPLSELPGRRIH